VVSFFLFFLVYLSIIDHLLKRDLKIDKTEFISLVTCYYVPFYVTKHISLALRRDHLT